MPFLSVLIPVYNGADYLANAIESALGQPCRDLEVLVADDGSTDASLSIARDYERADSRVRVITHGNVGPGQTRNEAIPQLKGEWILFLDCDDIILPGFYTERVRDFLSFCADHQVETIVPCRLYGNTKLTWANMEYVPFDEVFGQGSDASWRVDYEFATLLYSAAMLRRENIEFGTTRPAEMESIFRHKAVFCSTRTVFTNRLWFAVRRENPHQATRDRNWNSAHVDRIRYDGFNDLIEWHRRRGTTGFVIEEATRRRDAAAAALERDSYPTTWKDRLRAERDHLRWKRDRKRASKPLAAWVLTDTDQDDAVAALRRQIEEASAKQD